MLRKWLLSSSMVTGSRYSQEMLIEGQILDNSIHHCFQNCFHPPSWRLSVVKKGDMLQLLFLAKAANHKLYCNYCSDGDFYHHGHLGHMWSLPSTFQLSRKGQIHTHLSPTPSHPPPCLFVVAQVLFFCVLLVNNIQVNDRCWADIKPAVFCVQVHRVSRLISKQSGTRNWLRAAWGNISAHWE